MRPVLASAIAALALLILGPAFSACRPELGDRESSITRTRVLAGRGEPPEAKPGEVVSWTLLVASPSGPLAMPVASWAFCSTPKLLTENGAASAACLRDAVRPLAEGPPAIEAAIPADACALFGPQVTSADLRPRDPDVTGGFYQPVRVTVFDHEEPEVAFGLQRIGCALANAAADVTTDFAARYVPNANPELGPLEATLDGAPLALDAIPAGATIRLRTSWPAAAAERYVVYDLATRTLAEHRETMRVSWFATAGSFESDRTGRSEDELETSTDNTWTAPPEPRAVHLFVVLRDARGGVAFATHTLTTK
ncbi:MAG: hypothetical protein J0I07_43260 [Myxococcales bacterium]|nr:hypothetical protein [Myxococcales bacterium]